MNHLEDNVKLHSKESSRLLQKIARLRANNVGNHINLPQLVVCGDQSAGKSSVLNGLIRIPFPRAEGVCTKFATEIIIEHTDANKEKITANIIPHVHRDEDSTRQLKSFQKVLKSYIELPDTISEAGACMGLRGYGNNVDGPGFALDVLRINVSGNTGMHLAIVDLPGLISVTADERHEEDKNIVHYLVDSYLENPRTIILAIMQASNDFANLPIIGKVRRFDKDGERTIGIITKPDLINKGCYGRIAKLASNKDQFKLKLGFFIVKNPEPHEVREGLPYRVLQYNEARFFAGERWRNFELDPARVGILSLREFVKEKLDQHIRIEMPKVRTEIHHLLRSKQEELNSLGAPRETATDLRVFLTKLSQDFQALVFAGLHGHYDGPEQRFFGLDRTKGNHIRLRAMIHQLNAEFSTDMAAHGAKRTLNGMTNQETSASRGPPLKKVRRNPMGEGMSSGAGPRIIPLETISHEEMMAWVAGVHSRTRGQELPGESNPSLLSALFHEQSSRWPLIAQQHIHNVHTKIGRFMRDALDFVFPLDVAADHFHDTLETLLERNLNLAEEELKRLEQDESQQPMTYNDTFADDLRSSRQIATQEAIQTVPKATTQGGFTVDTSIIVDSANATASTETIAERSDKACAIEMDKRTCSEAFDALQAYYRLARNTWVDNVCRQIIERHLLNGLINVFNPTTIAAMTEEEMTSLAGEMTTRAEKRQELANIVQDLQRGFNNLRG